MTSGFGKLVFDVSQQLRSSDVEALQYIYKVAVENGTNLGVLKALEKRGLFSSTNIEGLKNLLCNIDRYDLLDMLKEDKRLELCYFQAVSMEENLEAIRTDLAKFCSKQECSPTERSFCGGIRERVQLVQKQMMEYLISPLREVYLENTDGRLNSVALTTTTRSESSPASVKISRSQSKMCSPSHLRHLSDGDYDLLSPISRSPSHVTTQAAQSVYANVVEKDSKSPRQWRRTHHNTGVPDSRNAAVHVKPLATSGPSTPLFGQRRLLNRSSSSDNLLASAQGSRLPVLTKKTSLNGYKRCSASDMDTSGDSGFADASEFSLFRLEAYRASTENLYSRPNKLTVNEPHTYMAPTKK